jgi:hypothetical protein
VSSVSWSPLFYPLARESGLSGRDTAYLEVTLRHSGSARKKQGQGRARDVEAELELAEER